MLRSYFDSLSHLSVAELRVDYGRGVLVFREHEHARGLHVQSVHVVHLLLLHLFRRIDTLLLGVAS